MKMHVVRVMPRSGVNSKNNRPWSMLQISGIISRDDGTQDTARLTLFESPRRPLPAVAPGATYELHTEVFPDQDGELRAHIVGLTPVGK